MQNEQEPSSVNNTAEGAIVPENTAQTQPVLAPIGVFVWDLAKIVLLATVVIIPIRFLVFQPFIVSGSSMEPNFTHGDYLIIDEISYRFNRPERGEVIVLRYPEDPSQFFIKRIIGLPGDRLVFNGGKVKVYPGNGYDSQILDENYLVVGTFTSPIGDDSIVLGSGQYYVLGDNRVASSDSRVWGPLERTDIVGKVWVKVFPLSDLSFFKTPQYSQ